MNMMFGDVERVRRLAYEMLEDFELDELLEFNDLSDVDVLEFLIESGLINEPEAYFDG